MKPPAENRVTGGLAIWPVRVESARLGERLAQQLDGELLRPWESELAQKDQFRALFARRSQWVLIMATGIAARFIDGQLRDKHQDPAVVVLDEAGRYAIALVGGHEAGANGLAYRVANAIGAVPVVTTATEAVKPLVVGIGCRKGVAQGQIEKAVLGALVTIKADVTQIRELATVDLKANEPGLVAFAQRHGLPLRIILKQQIETRPWVTQPSEWVKQSVGLDGVCEPCALIASPRGKLVVPKMTLDGVAVAVVEDVA